MLAAQRAEAEDGRSLLLADADSRGLSGSAGYDRGFVIRDESGQNSLRINAQMQFRYLWNQRREDSSPGANDRISNGFQIRRMRLKFSGTVISERLGYKIMTGYTSLLGGPVRLLDAYGTYRLESGWRVRWGQYKAVLLREFNVSSSKQLATERSIVNAAFTQGRTLGIEASRSWDRTRTWIGVTQGGRTRATDLSSPRRANVAFDVRGEWLMVGADGSWKRLDDFSSFRGQPFAAMGGAAMHYQTGGATNGTADDDQFWFSADASLEGDGWSAMAQYVGRYTDLKGTPTVFDQGVTLQGGVFVTDQTEVFGRWAVLIPGDRPSGDGVFNSVTAGASYFVIPNSHALKLTGDVSVYLNDVSGATIAPPGTGIGLLPDLNAGQFVFRLQMQMLF